MQFAGKRFEEAATLGKWTRAEIRSKLLSHAVNALLLAALILIAIGTAMAQADRSSAPVERSKVLILGVEHSAELVAESYQPAVFRAFFDRVKPDAICIERSPQEFARADFYEFTYEAQSIAVPYARSHGIEICPIDWLPSSEDSLLAWGIPDIEAPPFVRNDNGFQGFINFDDPASLKLKLFDSEAESDRAAGRDWSDKPAPEARADFARRLFLYRTYMQAMRIRRVAQRDKGKTVLVVVGSMHKDDLERVLAGFPDIEVTQPSTYGAPDAQAVAKETTLPDLSAIAVFNLLGTQAKTGNVDWGWMGRVVDRLEMERPSPETTLLKTRLGVLTKKLAGAEAIREYQQIQAIVEPYRFTFTGVKDGRRVDSYFDPFGNLTVQQRAALELARESLKAGRTADAEQWRNQLLKDPGLSDLQRAQLNAYWETYVVQTF